MRSDRRSLILLAILALFGSSRPLAAETWTEERPLELNRFSLESIEFEGDLVLSEDDLRSVIKSSTSGLIRFRPVDADRIDGDVIRLRNYYRREGYWNVEVTRRLYFEHEKRKTRAVFTIVPGPQRLVGRVQTQGNRTFSEEDILEGTELRSGDPFALPQTSRDRTIIENLYANAGFYEVSVTADIQPTETLEEPISHDLIYRIEEGQRYFVGEIQIVGNEFTNAKIIRNELTIATGEVLNRERLDESRLNLFGTGYFSWVEMVPQNLEMSEGTVDVLVRVEERNMRFVNAGVGYGTRDQLRLSGEWGHRNLFGRGKRASLRGILATELFPADLVRVRLEGRYVEPLLFGTRTSGTAGLSFERRREFTNIEGQSVEYDLQIVTLELNASRRLSRSTRGWMTLKNEWFDQDVGEDIELPEETQVDVTRSIETTVERDRRDSYFNPTKGTLQQVQAKVSGGILGGDNDYWQIFGEPQGFKKLKGVVLATRLRVGYGQPYGQSRLIPDQDRFKIGGPNSVRGYNYRTIGPGDFLLLANVEARFPIVWVLRGALFIDGGNAWPDISDVRWDDFSLDPKPDPAEAAQTDFRYSVGGGLRVGTPVGPVRLDYGYKLKILPPPVGESEEDSWQIHLSLGHVF